MAVVAKKQKENNITIDEVILDQIKDLYIQVDLNTLGDKAVDVAADLFYSIPSLAIELIEKTSANGSKNINDWAITKLTFSAIKSNTHENKDKSNMVPPKLRTGD